jgi:hypothetical protein
VNALREYWSQNKDLPLTERWRATLMNDHAGPDAWLEAAMHIVKYDQPKQTESRAFFILGADLPFPGAGQAPPLQGEQLRDQRRPSITELMQSRIDVLRVLWDQTSWERARLEQRCELALHLARWDLSAAQSALRQAFHDCRDFTNRTRLAVSGIPFDRWIGPITVARIQSGDPRAAADYAALIRASAPETPFLSGLALAPVIASAQEPEIRELIQWMFADAQSPWNDSLRLETGLTHNLLTLFQTELVATPGFQAWLKRGLQNKATAGRVIRRKALTIEGTNHLGSWSVLRPLPTQDPDLPPDSTIQSFRYCDLYAAAARRVEGMPWFELFWPEAKRDEAIAKAIETITSAPNTIRPTLSSRDVLY